MWARKKLIFFGLFDFGIKIYGFPCDDLRFEIYDLWISV